MSLSTRRRRVALALDPKLREEPGLSRTNTAVITLIIISLVVAVLETEPVVYEGREALFLTLEVVFVSLFGLEYLLRVWTSIENPEVGSRLRYMLQPSSLFDLFTILVILLTTLGASGFLLRLARIMRVLRIARLGQFSSAFDLLARAVAKRRFELFISAGAAVLLLFVSAALLYVFEGGAQPEQFGSIPRAMWWSIATLTTVGYGDVYPITVMGRIFAAFTAISGIGLIAMPTGILASAVSDAIKDSQGGN